MRALRAVYPDLRAIHMVRDGRDVVRSYMRLAPYELTDAARWLNSVRAAQAFGRRYPEQYLEVRYEHLVTELRGEIARVTSFLEVPFHERLLRHHEVDLKLLDVDEWPIFRGVLEPPHTRAVGRWREYFDTKQIAELERLLGSTLSGLGYAGPT